MKNYSWLKRQYKEYVSLDQLYRICKISKKSARYLVKNGIIPAVETGHKTWRYKIAINDVITYLRKRDKVGSMIPPGAVSNCAQSTIHRRAYSQLVATESNKSAVIEYFHHVCAEFDEILSTGDIMMITGLSKSTILKLLQDGHIPSIGRRPRYVVPKEYLLEFLVTPKFLEMRTGSKMFAEVLDGLEKWMDTKYHPEKYEQEA